MLEDVGGSLRHHLHHPVDVRPTELQRLRQLHRDTPHLPHTARLIDGDGDGDVAGRQGYFHRVTMTFVPPPTREATSNSLTRRFEPPKPSPMPRLVVKPSVIACSRSAMPSP